MASPTTDAVEFSLLTSLRHDPILLRSDENTVLSGRAGQPTAFYMLRYHRDRLLEAAEHFAWENVTSRLGGDAGLVRFHDNLTTEVGARQTSMTAMEPLKVGR